MPQDRTSFLSRITPEILRRMSPRARKVWLALLALGGAGGGVIVVTRPDRPPYVRPDEPTRPPPVRPPPVDPGTRPPPVDPSGVLARVRVSPPDSGQLVIRVNVPVAQLGPMHLVDRDGRALATQATVVTRGPQDEARMVEIMALAQTNAGTQEFGLVAGASIPGPAVSTDVDLKLRAVDHAGTTYVSTDATSVMTRSGPVAMTEERRGYLRSQAGDALLGFIIAETQIAGEDFTLCELVVHNGPVPVQGDSYFTDLRLIDIPAGQVVAHLLPHPWADPNGALIKANVDGTMHVMLQKQCTEFRFVVYEPQDSARALSALRMDGFGVCVPGKGLWSPQNPNTPWYFPQAMPMPTYVAGMNLDAYPYEMTVVGMRNALANGTSLPAGGGGNSGAAGPYHPWGSSYGGVTGGIGIWQYDGLGVLLTGRADKLHEVMAYHRTITDRHRTGIFDMQGGVQRAEQLAPGWKLSAYPGVMWNGKEGQLNWKAASQWRRDQVEALGLRPSYESYLASYEPLDFQHHGRKTAASCSLVWLCNDSIGRWSLEVEAEQARMYSYETGEGELAAALAKSAQFPGKGAFGGRDAGWVRFAVAAWYQVTPNRDRLKPWMEANITVLERSQLPSGCWLAHESGKPTDGFGDDAATQAIEDGINVGAGVAACYAATGDPRYAVLLRNVGDRYAFHWAMGKGSPYTRSTPRPKNPALPAYTLTNKPQPVVLDLDNWQTWSLLASAKRAGSTGVDALIMDAFGGNPLAKMLEKPTFQLDNKAGLIALYQIMVGQ